MNKNKIQKIAIISIVVAIVIIGGGFGIFKYNKIQTYNNLINTANKDMDQGEYDQAIALFNQSLQYKNDPNIQKNIKLAKNLKEVKNICNEGKKLMDDKKYSDAIAQFQKVTKEDDKLYNNAQKNIEECKKQLIVQNIQLANDAVKNNKYDDANKYLDEVFKLDTNSSDAKKLKDDIAKAIQKQKDEVEATKASTKTTTANGNISPDEAIQMVKQLLPRCSFYDVDHNEVVNGVECYVVHAYTVVNDGNGTSHTATSGWIAVQKTDGKMFNDILDTSHIKSLN